MAAETGADAYNGRLTPFVVLCCVVAASGGIIFGYDLGASGGVSSMEPFVNKFFPGVHAKMKASSGGSNYCRFDSQLLTAFTSSLYVTGLFASLLAAPVTRVLGRRTSMLVGGAAFAAGAGLSGAALNLYMLVFGRLLLGIGIGFTSQSVPLYLSEMAPPWYRGAINNGFETCVSIGILLANMINYGTQNIHANLGWRLSLASAAAPALFLTIGTVFLPETPSSIIQRTGDLQEVIKILQRMRGTTDVQREVDDLIAISTESRTTRHPFRRIIQKQYRPQLVMAFALPLFQQLTGIDFITFYGPILFRTIGLQESAALLYAIVITLVATIFKFIAMFIVDRLGRRALFTIGGIQMLIPLVMVGVIMAAQLGDQGRMREGYSYLVLVLICAIVGGFSLSWGPLTWLIASEIFPLEIRSAGQSIVVAIVLLLKFIIAQMSLAMLCHLKFGTFFFFGGWLFVMTLFMHMFLPETKDVPIEQMDKVWKEHWFWKKIVSNGDKAKTDTEMVTS